MMDGKFLVELKNKNLNFLKSIGEMQQIKRAPLNYNWTVLRRLYRRKDFAVLSRIRR